MDSKTQLLAAAITALGTIAVALLNRYLNRPKPPVVVIVNTPEKPKRKRKRGQP